MSIVFAGAPIVTAVVRLLQHKPPGGYGSIKPLFYVGILLAALGGCLVSYFGPPASAPGSLLGQRLRLRPLSARRGVGGAGGHPFVFYLNRNLNLYLNPPDMQNPPNAYFDHERLIVYQRSIQFVAWVSPLLESIPSKFSRSVTNWIEHLRQLRLTSRKATESSLPRIAAGISIMLAARRSNAQRVWTFWWRRGNARLKESRRARRFCSKSFGCWLV